jgi:hypothetical protein
LVLNLLKALASPVGNTPIQDSVVTQKGLAKMNTQGKHTPTRKPQPRPSKETLGLAQDAKVIRCLLWAKIISSATPEMKTMLLAYIHLTGSLDHLVPNTDRFTITHDTLLDEVALAESLLTGATHEVWTK